MTAMAEKMSEAGLDLARARLDRVACDALRQAQLSLSGGLRSFKKILREDDDLLTALAEPYMRQRHDDMRSTRDGVSQVFRDSQEPDDRSVPAPTKSLLSHADFGSHVSNDRPATSRGGASQQTAESHDADDRTSPSSTSISKLAATRVAKNSIYDMRIGVELTFRTAKLYDIINNERAGSRYTRVMTLLRTRKAWPDDAAVPDVYSEKELRAIMKEADKAMPPLPIEAFTHG